MEHNDEERKNKRLLFDGKIAIILPDAVQPMKPELAQEKFPYDTRPEIILSDETGMTFYTFTLLEQPLAKQQIKSAIAEIEKCIASLYPSSILVKATLLTNVRTPCGWFAYQMATEQGDGYHIMYILSVQQKMMLGTCGCLLHDTCAIGNMKHMLQNIEIREIRSRLR